MVARGRSVFDDDPVLGIGEPLALDLGFVAGREADCQRAADEHIAVAEVGVAVAGSRRLLRCSSSRYAIGSVSSQF